VGIEEGFQHLAVETEDTTQGADPEIAVRSLGQYAGGRQAVLVGQSTELVTHLPGRLGREPGPHEQKSGEQKSDQDPEPCTTETLGHRVAACSISMLILYDFVPIVFSVNLHSISRRPDQGECLIGGSGLDC
jgi:hypothetical protein